MVVASLAAEQATREAMLSHPVCEVVLLRCMDLVQADTKELAAAACKVFCACHMHPVSCMDVKGFWILYITQTFQVRWHVLNACLVMCLEHTNVVQSESDCTRACEDEIEESQAVGVSYVVNRNLRAGPPSTIGRGLVFPVGSVGTRCK